MPTCSPRDLGVSNEAMSSLFPVKKYVVVPLLKLFRGLGTNPICDSPYDGLTTSCRPSSTSSNLFLYHAVTFFT